MEFTEEELEEFRTESEELLAEAERSLLKVERGEDFKSNYDSIFRAFHSLKGAAGMLELLELQDHMHKVEHLFQSYKESKQINQEVITFFLDAIDASKSLLNFKPITFSYTIAGPQTKSIPETKATSKAPPVIPSLSPEEEKPLVFIIDDEEDIVEILGGIMDKFSLPWLGFTDPSRAMEELEEKKPSIVLSDMKMPEKTGLDVLRIVKKYNKDLPVIFISAHLSKEMLLEAMSYGINGVLEKPFREPQVISQVTAALQHYQMWQLLNKSIDLILFQYQDVEAFLRKTGKEQVANLLKKEVESLLFARREIRSKPVTTTRPAPRS